MYIFDHVPEIELKSSVGNLFLISMKQSLTIRKKSYDRIFYCTSIFLTCIFQSLLLF